MQAKLNVGDIVQCTIKRFVYFGIFVEVGPVPSSICHCMIFHEVLAADYFIQRLKGFLH